MHRHNDYFFHFHAKIVSCLSNGAGRTGLLMCNDVVVEALHEKDDSRVRSMQRFHKKIRIDARRRHCPSILRTFLEQKYTLRHFPHCINNPLQSSMDFIQKLHVD